jgi:pyridoxine kinase
MQSPACNPQHHHTTHLPSPPFLTRSHPLTPFPPSPLTPPGNHTGYHRFTGTRTPAPDITSLYSGLKASHLTDFSLLLSGYIPSAESVQAVGAIARDLRLKSATKPGGFFWLLDPVMGDQGKLYVEEGIVSVYRGLLREADCVVPNSFEVELLAGLEKGFVAEHGEEGVREAIEKVHNLGVRHVVVTSVKMKGKEGLVVVGSTSRGDGGSRCWKIEVKELDCFFSGTGDMFAALLVGRLREKCKEDGLLEGKSWASGDGVKAEELPLARACEEVLSSMQMVLEKTMKARNREMERFERRGSGTGTVEGDQSTSEETRRYLAQTKAAEVRVVKNWRDLVEPEKRYKAVPLMG